MIIKNLPKFILNGIGSFDRAGRYTLDPFFETETSRAIRMPSRAFNLSIYKHVQTQKYLKSLNKEQLNAIKIMGNF